MLKNVIVLGSGLGGVPPPEIFFFSLSFPPPLSTSLSLFLLRLPEH